VVELIGEVDGRVAPVVDDFTISAGTLVDASRVLVERGAREVYAAVTHGLFAGDAMRRIGDSPTGGSSSRTASRLNPSR